MQFPRFQFSISLNMCFIQFIYSLNLIMLAGRGGKNFFLCRFYFHCSQESEGDVADEFAVFMWTTFFIMLFLLYCCTETQI